MQEHKETVHKINKVGEVVVQIKCAYCDKEFSKKSNAVRHEKCCKQKGK